MSHLLLQTCTDSLSIAKIISKKIIDNNLSPCVHIINSPTTLYKWEGKTINTKEYIIQIKTIKKLKNTVIKLIKEEHNYKNPELISQIINIESKNYESWFNKELNL
tara:strand:+ start:254 stop:571 length:318 start_codon:yes stop_codon:yes gene_type:complete